MAMMYTVDTTTVTSSTSATLADLLCNRKYTVWVYAEGEQTGRRSVSRIVSLPARGIHFHMAVYCMYIMACGSMPYVGMTPKKNGSH